MTTQRSRTHELLLDHSSIGPLLAATETCSPLLGPRAQGVMLLGHDMHVLYANELVWARPRSDFQSKCYEIFSNQSSPCRACPAERALQARPDGPPVSFSTDAGTPLCGIQHVVVLRDADGKIECALVMLEMNHTERPAVTSPLDRNGGGGQLAGDPHLIGQSVEMQRLVNTIHQVAASQAAVLLQGESGTGKELAAKTIHRLSDRRERPFIVVDCGSLTETLLESELFGHVKGAFTGASSSKKGLFEEADGGTLFLDEIADTTLHFQAKLLRVIQEGEIKPVGSARAVKIDVRIISATNKDLLGLIKRRTFREDLYYRLAVLPLTIPALRERRDDIPLLAAHFVELSCRRHRRPVRTISAGAMRALTQLPWLGNVRQLQHAVERAVLTGAGSYLTEKDFEGLLSAPVHTIDATFDLASVTKQAVRTAECARIHEALRHAKGSKAAAARLLNISRASLYIKLREYRIPHPLD